MNDNGYDAWITSVIAEAEAYAPKPVASKINEAWLRTSTGFAIPDAPKVVPAPAPAVYVGRSDDGMAIYRAQGGFGW